MMFRTVGLVALSISAHGVVCGQPVYQCLGPDGRKIFQQAPCTDGRRVDAKPALMGGTTLGDRERLQAAVSDAKRKEALAEKEQAFEIAIQPTPRAY